MKKLLIAVFSILVCLAGALIWLLSTESGLQQVLRGVTTFTSLELQVGRASGRLAGPIDEHGQGADKIEISPGGVLHSRA